MKAAIYNEPFDVVCGKRPDPAIISSTDAIVEVTMACVCGSDLWYYRGISKHAQGSIGHEFIGIIGEVGRDVRLLQKGDLVIAPFLFNDGTCPNCLNGWPSSCSNGAAFGNGTIDGGQGEAVRVPFADATLVPVHEKGLSHTLFPSLLSLADVMCTGHHAALSARVFGGSTVVVVGDGAVGLSGVLASKRLGAERIIALSRHETRQKLARTFGATDIVEARGDDAVQAVKELTDGHGADATLECVGTEESANTAFRVARPGSIVGMVGVPHGVRIPMGTLFGTNVGVRGGVAPARKYIPELLPDILDEKIAPGLVFDYSTTLDEITDAYLAMHERRAIKSLIRVK